MLRIGDKIEPEFVLSYELGYSSMRSINPLSVTDDIATFTLLYNEAKMPCICGLNSDNVLVTVVEVPEVKSTAPLCLSLNEYAEECNVKGKMVKSVKTDLSWMFAALMVFLVFVGICSI